MNDALESPSPKNIKWVITSLLAALGASLCCIAPVLAVVAGISGAAAMFSWLDPFRPYLIGFTLLILSYVWYQRIKPTTQEAIDCACEEGGSLSFWQTKTFLSIITLLVTLLLTFPYYSGVLFPSHQAATQIVTQKNSTTTTLTIEGMTCTGCESSVNQAIKSENGVISCTASYKAGEATVKFDTSKTNIQKLAKALENKTGYKATTKN